ncbi:MAG: ABC transporter permease subunit [Alphaproteobacteria bacterium]|jgi:putative spermidine/putrescine transport system permease protein|nr:ABC transporter permease subunit [Alphaproteobacteria bacterium]
MAGPQIRTPRLRLIALAAPGLAALGFFFILPLAVVAGEAFAGDAFARFLASADLIGALGRSLLLGIGAGGVSLVVGIAVALHLSRLPPARRALLQLVIALPLTFSGLIIAYGFILVLGRAGFVTLLLAEIGVDPGQVAALLYGPAGLVMAYAYYLTPRVVLMLLPVFANFDQRQIDAAESMGAGRARALIDILAPQVAPTAFAAFCLVAAVAIGTYGTALALVGTQLDILPLRLYSMVADAGADFPLAAATSIVLLATCSLLMGVAEVVAARAESRHV